jgi:hypothetical protein
MCIGQHETARGKNKTSQKRLRNGWKGIDRQFDIPSRLKTFIVIR